MIYANTSEGIGIEAKPGRNARCPDCDMEMIPKCGSVIVWHWAHKTSPDETCHYKPETAWHLRWKRWALRRGCRIEVPVGNHRADIITPTGLVVELQSQSLSADEVADREATYGSMIWIYRVDSDQLERIHWGKQLAGGRGFWYKRGPKLLTAPTKPVYLDLPEADYEDEIHRVKVNLKDCYSDQWGTTSQRLLGIAWPERAYAVLGIPEIAPRPSCELCGERPSVRDGICGFCWLSPEGRSYLSGQVGTTSKNGTSNVSGHPSRRLSTLLVLPVPPVKGTGIQVTVEPHSENPPQTRDKNMGQADA